jgi:cytochrome c biogenesis protein ResB
MSYRDKTSALGFSLTLNRFHMDHYPGTRRPRSFESHATIVDPVTGRQQNRIVSMNNPVKHAGYSLFQSSYRPSGGQWFSSLSVARDPGLPIVYTGYVATMVGMVVLLVTRLLDQRRRGAFPTRQPTSQGSPA